MIWGLARGLLFAVVIAQTLMGKFGSRDAEVWGWFLPSILPTLSLIVAVYGREAFRDETRRSVRKTPYVIAVAISVFYLAVLTISIIFQPVIGRSIFDVIEKT